MVLEQQRYETLMRTLPTVPLNPIFLLLLEFLRRLVPVLIMMAVYFFLVSPLLNEEFLKSLGSRNLVSFLARKLARLLRFCRRLLRAARALVRAARKGRRRVPDIADIGGPAVFESRFPVRKVSLRKRLQMGRVLKAFTRLLRWGQARGVPYRPCETPREYSLRLLSVVPQMTATLDLVIEVLEESLFSTHIVEAQRISAYVGAIEEIRRSPVTRLAAQPSG